MLNSYQISPKIDDIVKGTFFSNLHANLHGTLRSNFAFQNGRPQYYRPTEFPMQTNGDMQIRGVGIHAGTEVATYKWRSLTDWQRCVFKSLLLSKIAILVYSLSVRRMR